jgi:hypothetical protein
MTIEDRARAIGQVELFAVVQAPGPSSLLVPRDCGPDLRQLERIVGEAALLRLASGRQKVGVCACGGRCRTCPRKGGGENHV